MFKRINNFLYECIVIAGLAFLGGALLISAIEAGQWKERQLLEQVCKVNGQISINGTIYECGVKND